MDFSILGRNQPQELLVGLELAPRQKPQFEYLMGLWSTRLVFAVPQPEVRVSFPSISWRKMGWFGSVEWLLGFVFVTCSHVLHCPTKRSWKIQQILCAGGGWEAGCWARRGTLSFFWVYSIHMLYTFLCKFCMHPNHLSEAGQKQIYFDYLMVPLWFRHRSM